MTQMNQTSETATASSVPKSDHTESGGTMFDPTLLSAAGILPSTKPEVARAAGFVGRLRNRQFWMRALGYTGLGIVSFLAFLYLTFPYAVIKEGLVSFANDNMQQAGVDARLNIGSLKPYWFTGVALENVTLTNNRDSASQTRFGQVRARLQVLPLFIGRIGVNLYVSQSGGSMDVDLSLPIGGLISGAPALREGSAITFQKFPIDSFVGQGLSLAKGSTNPAMALIAPLLSVTSAGGMLDGRVAISSSDLNNPDTLKGDVALDVKGMYLHINDNVWQIPKQEFSKARIEAKLDKGAVLFKDSTAFVAPDIDVALGGRMGPGVQPGVMEAALNLKLAMRGRIQQNIGNLVPAFLKCLQPLKEKTLEDGRKEALLDAKLTGPFAALACEQTP